MAADSAATFVTGTGSHTAKQPTTKLTPIGEKAIFGHSGFVGLGQRLGAVFANSWVEKRDFKKFNLPRYSHHLRQRFWGEVIKDEVAVVNECNKNLRQLIVQTLMNNSIIAIPPIKDEEVPSLVHFNWNGGSEIVTQTLPTVAIGSGQANADPFLSFLRRVLWGDEMPATLADAIFGAAWTMDYVLKSSPGVGPPVEMMVIRKDENGDWIREQISEPRLDAHGESIVAIEAYLAEYPDKFKS